MEKEIKKIYWDNGNLWYEFEHNGDNVCNGYLKRYRLNGRLQFTGQCKDGVIYGMSEYFYDLGKGKYEEELKII